jgi:hypothetical protein
MFTFVSRQAAQQASTASKSRNRIPVPLAAWAIVSWLSGSAYAIEVVAIEEHWELSVGQPDAESSSPQVSMVMSPTRNLSDDYFVFTLNHHSDPAWIPGGMQVQHWNGQEIEGSRVGPHEAKLQESDEVIRWVQRIKLEDDSLVFEVVNGQSDSWGEFGGQGHLRFTLDTTRENLNDYRPSISLEESGVSFAGNRVRSLILRKLRWIDSEGQAHELNAPIDVDADLDP